MIHYIVIGVRSAVGGLIGGGVRGGQLEAEMGAAACLAGTQKRGASLI